MELIERENAVLPGRTETGRVGRKHELPKVDHVMSECFALF